MDTVVGDVDVVEVLVGDVVGVVVVVVGGGCLVVEDELFRWYLAPKHSS